MTFPATPPKLDLRPANAPAISAAEVICSILAEDLQFDGKAFAKCNPGIIGSHFNEAYVRESGLLRRSANLCKLGKETALKVAIVTAERLNRIAFGEKA